MALFAVLAGCAALFFNFMGLMSWIWGFIFGADDMKIMAFVWFGITIICIVATAWASMIC